MTETRRILIVDDSPEDRETYRRFLSYDREFAYEIVETASGEEGLKLCESWEPDCVLLDNNLPDLNGLEFLTELNGMTRDIRMAIVMLTGSESIAAEAFKNGAQDYLVKGNLSRIDFQRAVENAIEKVNLMKAIERHRRELARSNDELAQFAYAASHDLQAPLRRTKAFCQLLQNKYQAKLGPEADELIGFIVQCTDQMQALVSGLLEYGRAGTGGRKFAWTDCSAVVDEAITNLESAIRESGATVTRDELPTILADRIQLVQLFQNLIGNALRYRGDRVPAVHVGGVTQTGLVTFSVQDNGIGIDMKYAEAIFKVFRRLHGDDQYRGCGIGLAICKKIVERHKGHIWVESRPGLGSIFYFTIPKTG